MYRIYGTLHINESKQNINSVRLIHLNDTMGDIFIKKCLLTSSDESHEVTTKYSRLAILIHN